MAGLTQAQITLRRQLRQRFESTPDLQTNDHDLRRRIPRYDSNSPEADEVRVDIFNETTSLTQHEITSEWVHNFRIPGWDPTKPACVSIRQVEKELFKHIMEGRPEREIIPMSTFYDRDPEFVPFTRSNRLKKQVRSQVIVIDNLEGASAGIAFSKKGMRVVRMWEDEMLWAGTQNNGFRARYRTGTSLDPGQGPQPVQNYLTDVQNLFAQDQEDLQGGQSHVVLPVWGENHDWNGAVGVARPHHWRYNYMRMPILNNGGYQTMVDTPFPPQLVQSIMNAVRVGAGHPQADSHRYLPSENPPRPGVQNLQAPLNPPNEAQTLAVVFDDGGYGAIGPGPKRLQIWLEGRSLLPPSRGWQSRILR